MSEKTSFNLEGELRNNSLMVEGKTVDILDGIQLTEDQRQKAIEIVKESLDEFKGNPYAEPQYRIVKESDGIVVDISSRIGVEQQPL